MQGFLMVALFTLFCTSIFFPYSILDIAANGVILDCAIECQAIFHK